MDKKSFLLGILAALVLVPAISIAATLITTAQIADNAITSRKIATGAVGGSDIANSAVTKYKIATGAVTGSRIGDGTVGIADLNASEGNATFDLDAFAASECRYIEIPVSGTQLGDYAIVSPVDVSNGIGEDVDTVWTAFVYQEDYVDVNICNVDAANPTHDIASQTWNAIVIHR